MKREKIFYCNKRKGTIRLIDTETVNDDKIIVDYAGVDILTSGIVINEFGYILKEVYENEELMNGKWVGNKKDIWKEQLESGTKKLISIYTLAQMIKEEIKKYNIKALAAYNLAFDVEALENTFNYFGIKDNELMNLIKLDVYKSAEKYLILRENYAKFCWDNGLLTESNNNKTSVEAVYRFLTNDNKFKEQHIADLDVKIETNILISCMIKSKGKLLIGYIDGGKQLVNKMKPYQVKVIQKDFARKEKRS